MGAAFYDTLGNGVRQFAVHPRAVNPDSVIELTTKLKEERKNMKNLI